MVLTPTICPIPFFILQDDKLCGTVSWIGYEWYIFINVLKYSRLIALYYDTERCTDSLSLVSQLLKELKKLDDKNLLVEVQLLESKTYHALSNLSKALAALTSGD